MGFSGGQAKRRCANCARVRGLMRAVCDPFTFHFISSESVLKHDTQDHFLEFLQVWAEFHHHTGV